MSPHDFTEQHQALPDPEWLQDDDGYRQLADHIIAKLNPPDGEESEEWILTTAIDRAVAYIQAQPCTCPPGAAEFEVEPCARCDALGRRADTPVER